LIKKIEKEAEKLVQVLAADDLNVHALLAKPIDGGLDHSRAADQLDFQPALGRVHFCAQDVDGEVVKIADELINDGDVDYGRWVNEADDLFGHARLLILG
jgi:hypothetical protein